MPIYFRRCNWEGCGAIVKHKSRHYCDKHRIETFIKSRARVQVQVESIRKEIDKMKREEYQKIYAKLKAEVREEDGN
jgi:hypothetical protein